MIFAHASFVVLGLGKTGRSVVKWLQGQSAKTIYTWDDQGQTVEFGTPVSHIQSIPWGEVTALIQSPGVPFFPPHPVTREAQERGYRILTDLDLFRLTYPTHPWVGITGTNGKSTTTALTTHLLQSLKVPVAMGGNIGIPVLELPQLNPTTGMYVIELSSFQLEISSSLHLRTAVWMNFTPDHLDRHVDMASYQRAKEKIFDHAQSAVISVDDSYSFDIHQRIASQIPTFSVSVQGHPATVKMEESILYEGDEKIANLKKRTRLLGRHNEQNIAIAYATLRTLGWNPEEITPHIQTFPGLPHRQEMIREIDYILFVNDSKATNPDSALHVLQAFSHRKIFWILGGRPKPGGISLLLPFLKPVQEAFLIGEASDAFYQTLKEIIPTKKCGTVENALQEAYKEAQQYEGHSVVLFSPACASFDQFRNFEHRGDTFRALVMQLTSPES